MKVGQRWISQAEPELGLGKIIEIEKRHVTILFAASEVVRRYSASSAPIQRIRFQPGDRVHGQDGLSFTVTRVEEEAGILIYRGRDRFLPETRLSDLMAFDSPEDRFKANQIDPVRYFELRSRTLFLNHLVRSSSVRGFVGGRIDLIPHQFYIAHEVARRNSPRVLLSDETGLGKTIEAALIMHRLLLCGRVERVLILLPETLVHQWFIELFRRFNLVFRIYDKALCEALEKSRPGDNPFLEDQLIIISTGLIETSRERVKALLAAPWDLLIVDEAHHYQEHTGPYKILEKLAARAGHLLLLTATPEQLGFRSHFARIRLLDPARYDNLETFREEMGQYHHIADVAGKLMNPETRNPGLKQTLAAILDGSPDRCMIDADKALKGDESALNRTVAQLVDLHGVGRAVLRNTRRIIKGFPRRQAHLEPLSGVGLDSHLRSLAEAFAGETAGSGAMPEYGFDQDPRIRWLAGFLRNHKQEKVLLICRNTEKVLAIQSALAKITRIHAALFHERLSLLQRDRNAAWFAEKDGARILLCSEIGSEGRNFQFARHLVLFDLPLNPELLEQRIGRLDRIGQETTIHIHIPYITGSVQEVLARWYHEGLNALEKNTPGGNLIEEKFGQRLRTLAISFHTMEDGQTEALGQLISETRDFQAEVALRLEQGRDRLLELGSFKKDTAGEIVNRVRDLDGDEQLESHMLNLFDYFGIEAEPAGKRTHILKPTIRFNEAFHWLKEDRMTVTFARSIALAREDIVFLTWDHPMVLGAMDMLLTSEKGNCVFVALPDPEARSVVLEAVFMLETVAPVRLHPDRFLSATPIHVFVNHMLEDVTPEFGRSLNPADLKDLAPAESGDKVSFLRSRIPDMIAKAREIARGESREIRQNSLDCLKREMDGEILRLQALNRLGSHISPEEIGSMIHEKEVLEESIHQARLRLEAMRVIWAGALV